MVSCNMAKVLASGGHEDRFSAKPLYQKYLTVHVANIMGFQFNVEALMWMYKGRRQNFLKKNLLEILTFFWKFPIRYRYNTFFSRKGYVDERTQKSPRLHVSWLWCGNKKVAFFHPLLTSYTQVMISVVSVSKKSTRVLITSRVTRGY